MVFIVDIFCSFQKFLNEDTDHEAELGHEELSCMIEIYRSG